jgi:hypothetical protein
MREPESGQKTGRSDGGNPVMLYGAPVGPTGHSHLPYTSVERKLSENSANVRKLAHCSDLQGR